jgi:hypothetical protein
MTFSQRTEGPRERREQSTVTCANIRARTAQNFVLVFVLLVSAAQWRPLTVRALPVQSPQTTAKRLREKGWWPTRTDAVRKELAGTESCGGCHQEIVLAQQKTSMAHASSRAFETPLLRSNPSIAHSTPPFQTVISRDRAGSTYTVSRGGEAMSGPLLWSMGDGTMGQTFILRSGESLFESQLTYFPSIGGLDLTPGHSLARPQDLSQAFGAQQSAEIAQQCFACHTTASSVRGRFDATRAIPGVMCEACHGPGGQHVSEMQNNQIETGRDAILNPGSFDPVKLVDFCGACHRAPMDVAASKDYVPIDVRFQPYRLSKSRCWSQPDRRISCVGCHNPHEQLMRDVDFYDAKCLACHASNNVAATSTGEGLPATNKLPGCRVSANRCVSCHMPRYEVPQMHGSFTDHYIRVVRPGEQYPL